MSEFEDTSDFVSRAMIGSLEPRFMKNDDGREWLLTPPHGNAQSWTFQEVTLINAIPPIAPKIITQAVRLQDAASLAEYVNRFKSPDSMLFADVGTSTILAVIDYHTAVVQDANHENAFNPPTARHAKHTASLTVPHSIEWETWKKIDGQLMSHLAFANHLEENAMDILPLGELRNRKGEIVENAPTSILELCRTLQVIAKHSALSDVRNGDYVSFEVQKGDDIVTKQDINIPVFIELRIPVYFGERDVKIKAFLRRNTADGFKMGIKLERPEQTRQDEFTRIVGEMRAEVQLTTVYGRPA
jgi:uncharacterized protein YfdQ (DUF2303 family)